MRQRVSGGLSQKERASFQDAVVIVVVGDDIDDL